MTIDDEERQATQEEITKLRRLASQLNVENRNLVTQVMGAIKRAEAAEAKVALADAYGRYCAHVTIQSGAGAIPTFEEWLQSRA